MNALQNIYNELVRIVQRIPSHESEQAFLSAAREGDIEKVKRSVKYYGANILEAKNYNDATALVLAAEQKRKDVVAFLLESGANVNAQDKYGWSVLMRSVRESDDDMFALVLKHRPDVNLSGVNTNGTAMMIAAYQGMAERIEDLLAAGAAVDTPNHQGETALMYSMYDKSGRVFPLLMAAGADTEITTPDGKTAAHYAAAYAEPQRLLAVLDKMADTQKRHERACAVAWAAAFKGNVECLNALLQGGVPIDLRGENGKTLLMEAVAEGRDDAIAFLINCGADILAKDEDGKDVAQWAVKKATGIPLNGDTYLYKVHHQIKSKQELHRIRKAGIESPVVVGKRLTLSPKKKG